MDTCLSELQEMVMDKEAWRTAIHGVAKSRTRLSDWLNWRRLEAGMSITKVYEHSPSAWGWERRTKGYTPRLEVFEGFLLTTCFWEQELLVRDKTPFRVSPKLCYGLGSGNSILCLNALMFIWNGYVQVCLMLYSLKIIKLHNWIINFVSPLEAVPECPFQSAVLWALQLLPDLHIGFSRGRSGGLVFPSLSELSTVYCDPHSKRFWQIKQK